MLLKKYLIFSLFSLYSFPLAAKDYSAAQFNIYADGTTLNTRSIQFAIDYIHDHGGGRLIFDVGKYLTGSITLKSNVTLHLQEGAVLLGSLNPFDYDKHNWTALVFAIGQRNVGITGKGIINGRGQLVARNAIDLVGKGLLDDPLSYGRVQAPSRPVLVYFHQCDSVLIQGVTLKNSSSWVQIYSRCENVVIDGISVDSRAYWNNDGIDILNCKHVSVINAYVNSSDDGICLKSFEDSLRCEDILIRNCTIRSSANGIKFGTASYGGFSNVRIINNKVYNTYRSAIALEAVDGGTLDNVLVDSLEVHHTGNLIFLRIGERRKGKTGRLFKVKFKHIVADMAAEKPDKGYDYEGPVEDEPRNISPAIIIAGLPGAAVEDVTFEQMKVSHPGGADPYYARVPLDSVGEIPELADRYPDFSMFKELPSWALFVRHAGKIRFSNVEFRCERNDFRTPVVLDDVHDAVFHSVALEPANPSGNYYKLHSEGIIIK